MKTMRSIMITTGAVLFIVILSFAFIPSGSDGLEHKATVRIEYSGPYTGSIRGDETQQIEWEGDRDFDLEGDIIYVIVSKADDSNYELKASIIVNGGVRVSDSTTEPNGEVRISFSFLVGEDSPDDENNDNSNKGCGSIIMAPILFLMIGVLILAKRRDN